MDDIFHSKIVWQPHENKIYHEITQPSEDLILKRNHELRKNLGAIQDLGSQSGEAWGRQVASIPLNVYEAAIRNGYDLNSKDSEIAERELWRFLSSEDGKKCLIGGKNGR